MWKCTIILDKGDSQLRVLFYNGFDAGVFSKPLMVDGEDLSDFFGVIYLVGWLYAALGFEWIAAGVVVHREILKHRSDKEEREEVAARIYKV